MWSRNCGGRGVRDWAWLQGSEWGCSTGGKESPDFYTRGTRGYQKWLSSFHRYFPPSHHHHHHHHHYHYHHHQQHQYIRPCSVVVVAAVVVVVDAAIEADVVPRRSSRTPCNLWRWSGWPL